MCVHNVFAGGAPARGDQSTEGPRDSAAPTGAPPRLSRTRVSIARTKKERSGCGTACAAACLALIGLAIGLGWRFAKAAAKNGAKAGLKTGIKTGSKTGFRVGARTGTKAGVRPVFGGGFTPSGSLLPPSGLGNPPGGGPKVPTPRFENSVEAAAGIGVDAARAFTTGTKRAGKAADEGADGAQEAARRSADDVAQLQGTSLRSAVDGTPIARFVPVDAVYRRDESLVLLDANSMDIPPRTASLAGTPVEGSAFWRASLRVAPDACDGGSRCVRELLPQELATDLLEEVEDCCLGFAGGCSESTLRTASSQETVHYPNLHPIVRTVHALFAHGRQRCVRHLVRRSVHWSRETVKAAEGGRRSTPKM